MTEGFDPDTPLFVASGIFGAMDGLAEANMAVVRRELASHVFHKNQARAVPWLVSCCSTVQTAWLNQVCPLAEAVYVTFMAIDGTSRSITRQRLLCVLQC